MTNNTIYLTPDILYTIAKLFTSIVIFEESPSCFLKVSETWEEYKVYSPQVSLAFRSTDAKIDHEHDNIF